LATFGLAAGAVTADQAVTIRLISLVDPASTFVAVRFAQARLLTVDQVPLGRGGEIAHTDDGSPIQGAPPGAWRTDGAVASRDRRRFGGGGGRSG
jgi:hypothetical protein